MNISKVFKHIKRRLSNNSNQSTQSQHSSHSHSLSSNEEKDDDININMNTDRIENEEDNNIRLQLSSTDSNSSSTSIRIAPSPPISNNCNNNQTEQQHDMNQEERNDNDENDEEILPLDSDQSETDMSDSDDNDEMSDTENDESDIDNDDQSRLEPRGSSISIEEKSSEISSSPIKYNHHKLQSYSTINGNMNSLKSESICVETVTIPTIYEISWKIDQQSLNFAFLKNKNKNAVLNNTNDSIATHSISGTGVLEAEIIKNGIIFKLELCISGWKNSSRGYAAFYLTIPRQSGFNKNIKNKNISSLPPLVARYTVSIKNGSGSPSDDDINKISSIRDDFHLGVGFPNFCSSDKLIKSQEMNKYKQLRLDLNIEIFKTESRVKSIENVIYHQYLQKV